MRKSHALALLCGTAGFILGKFHSHPVAWVAIVSLAVVAAILSEDMS